MSNIKLIIWNKQFYINFNGLQTVVGHITILATSLSSKGGNYVYQGMKAYWREVVKFH